MPSLRPGEPNSCGFLCDGAWGGAGVGAGVERYVRQRADVPFDVPSTPQQEREPAGFAAMERPRRLHPAALVRPVVGADQFARSEAEEMVRPELHADAGRGSCGAVRQTGAGDPRDAATQSDGSVTGGCGATV